MFFLILLSCVGWATAEPATRTNTVTRVTPGQWTSLEKEGFPGVFAWNDTCNVYALRDGETAILIDLGDGSVLDHLAEIGVKRVEWVLFTHHHREQCQGFGRLAGRGVKIAAPEAERAFFERPQSFRRIYPTLNDPFTVHSASYVRPPMGRIPIDRGLARMDEFVWRSFAFRCVETKGNSPGAMSYFLEQNGRWLAFSGDVMLSGARMHNYFDTEWDYSFGSGIYALHHSAGLVAAFNPALLLPSHGPLVSHPKEELAEYQKKLEHLEKMVLRGYRVSTFAGADQDRISRPTSVPNIWQVSPHLFKFRGPNFWPNFHMILADSGHALVVDCGLFDKAFLDKALEGMREKLGLKQIDAVLLTHMHGDHMLEAPHLREKWGASIWALDNMVDKCEHPERFDYAAPIQSYGAGIKGVKIDRAFKKSGETFTWEGYQLTVEWMPGQTEFALCLHGMIDGKKVLFTGDNIDGNPEDPEQTGHEAIVARNSGILEEGYIYGAELLTRLQPDLILAGHSWAIPQPAPLIQRYRKWAYDMRETFRSLSSEEDYRPWFDPYWVRVEPYRVRVKRGQSQEVMLQVRNFQPREQTHRIQLHLPPGLTVEESVVEGRLQKESTQSFAVQIKAQPDAVPGVAIVPLDITLDGRRYGQWFDFVVEVE